MQARKSPFEAYQTYIALKTHFGSDYDYFKYNGKSNASQASLDRRNDKAFFHVISKHPDVEGMIVAYYREMGQNVWVGDLVTEECEDAYKKWQKVTQSLSYIFQNDLDQLLDNFDENIKVEGSKYPHLFQLYLNKKITVETFIILDELCGFFKYWNKKLAGDFIWNEVSTFCTKYKPFFIKDVDLKKMKSLVIKRFQ